MTNAEMIQKANEMFNPETMNKLNNWESSFVISIRRWKEGKALSSKQRTCFERIIAKLN